MSDRACGVLVVTVTVIEGGSFHEISHHSRRRRSVGRRNRPAEPERQTALVVHGAAPDVNGYRSHPDRAQDVYDDGEGSNPKASDRDGEGPRQEGEAARQDREDEG